MLVRDSVSRGPENPGSRVSWILELTFSPLHNVHTCALEQREADSLDGEKTVKNTLSISISMSLGGGRQSPGPTEIDKKERGGSYRGTGVWMLQILVPLSTPWTVTFHIWHSMTLLRSGTDMHPQHGVSPAPWDWAMWLPGLGNHLFWKLPDIITSCILWAAEVQTIKLEETQAIRISTFGLLCPNSFLWSDNIWGSWFLIFNCSC